MISFIASATFLVLTGFSDGTTIVVTDYSADECVKMEKMLSGSSPDIKVACINDVIAVGKTEFSEALVAMMADRKGKGK